MDWLAKRRANCATEKNHRHPRRWPLSDGRKGEKAERSQLRSRLTSRLPAAERACAKAAAAAAFRGPRAAPSRAPDPSPSGRGATTRSAGRKEGGRLTLRTDLVLDLQRGLQGHGLVETLPPAGRQREGEVAVQGVREARHPRQQRGGQSGQEQHREGQPGLFAHPCRAISGWKRRGRCGLSAPRLRLPPRTPRGWRGRETRSLRKLQAAAAAAANTPTEEHSPTSKG